MSKIMIGARVGMSNDKFIRSISESSRTIETDELLNPHNIIELSNILDWKFKLNVNLEKLTAFDNLKDWELIFSIAAIPAFYMPFEDIVNIATKEVLEFSTSAVDWNFVIKFLIREGIWSVKYA